MLGVFLFDPPALLTVWICVECCPVDFNCKLRAQYLRQERIEGFRLTIYPVTHNQIRHLFLYLTELCFLTQEDLQNEAHGIFLHMHGGL